MTSTIFAHANEVHDSTIVAQPVLRIWYVALLVFVLAITLVTLTIYFVSRKSKSVTYGALLALLFVVGVATYTISAPVSVLSLSLGFALSLLQVLFSLSKGGPK